VITRNSAHLRLVVPANPDAFVANPGAQAACQLVQSTLDRVTELFEFIDPRHVGAPGSEERLREAAELLQRAAEALEPVRHSKEEERRYQAWAEIYDKPPNNGSVRR
jgi:hypothetical protein